MAQELDTLRCPAPVVARFDLEVAITAGDALEMGLAEAQYQELSHVACGLFNALLESGANDQTPRFIDGATGLEMTEPLEIPSPGAGAASLSLPRDKTDTISSYLLTGRISRKSRKYLLVEAWVAAPLRGEIVFRVDREYDLASSGYENGVRLAPLIHPLTEKIRDFEQTIRDEEPGVVIGFGIDGAGQVQFAFDTDSLYVNRSTALKLKVSDCDGQPLRGLSLTLSAGSGVVQPSEVITNAMGEAVVNYKAPCEPGSYSIEVAGTCLQSSADPGGPRTTFSFADEIEVLPGRNLWLHYEHAASQNPGGEFTVNSTGKGVIACTIERVPDSVKVTGTGMVVVDWSSNIQDCIYSGRNNYKVSCFGLIVEGEDGSRWLEIARTGQDPMGGKFTMDCNGERQEVASPFPVPDHETGRPLRFEMTDGAVNTYTDPETGSEYRYVLDLGCDK